MTETLAPRERLFRRAGLPALFLAGMMILLASFAVRDEWYEFDRSPRPHVHVLARADESTYKPNKPMGDHPIIWTNEKYRRALYIGIGHDPTICRDPAFTVLMRDAIIWAASPGRK